MAYNNPPETASTTSIGSINPELNQEEAKLRESAVSVIEGANNLLFGNAMDTMPARLDSSNETLVGIVADMYKNTKVIARNIVANVPTGLYKQGISETGGENPSRTKEEEWVLRYQADTVRPLLGEHPTDELNEVVRNMGIAVIDNFKTPETSIYDGNPDSNRHAISNRSAASNREVVSPAVRMDAYLNSLRGTIGHTADRFDKPRPDEMPQEVYELKIGASMLYALLQEEEISKPLGLPPSNAVRSD